jgi:hypothetical protein
MYGVCGICGYYCRDFITCEICEKNVCEDCINPFQTKEEKGYICDYCYNKKRSENMLRIMNGLLLKNMEKYLR